MKPQLHTLSNGLRVMMIDTEAFPTLTTLLLVGAGSRYENKVNNGIAHFFEHMAFKGSKKYPNAMIISSLIDSLGGVFNAFTSKDYTGYWIKSTIEHFEPVVDVISDMVLHPLLATDEIEREKGVIVEEINMYEDNPQSKVGELFEGLLYPDNSLGFDVAGSPGTVTKFTRETFTTYLHDHYFPSNAILVLAGGFSNAKNSHSDHNHFLKIVEKKFGLWKQGNVNQFKNVVENQSKPQFLLKTKKTEQVHFALGFRAFPFNDPRRFALGILTTILGGGMSSRLFSEVREKRGLCYYIGSGREHYHDVGNVVTWAGVAKQESKVKEAIQVILQEHKKIIKGDVTEDEVSRAKEMMKGRLLLSLEDSFRVANYFGHKKLLENDDMVPSQAIAQYEKVSVEDVVKLAGELFVNRHLNGALIGPFENPKPFEEVLKI